MTDLRSMILITVPFTPSEKSFRMIPVHKDCPFLDVVYWKDKKVLEVVVPFKKNEYNMFTKLDDNGDPEKRKSPGKDSQGNPKHFKEERKITEVMMNYYITEKEDIEAFISSVAFNASSFDYQKYLNATDIVLPDQPKVIMDTPTIITP